MLDMESMKNFEGGKDPFNYGVEVLRGMEKDALDKISQMETSSGQTDNGIFRSNLMEMTNLYIEELRIHALDFQSEFCTQEAKMILNSEEIKKIFEDHTEYCISYIKEHMNEASEIFDLKIESSSRMAKAIEGFEAFVNEENKESYKKLQEVMINEYFDSMEVLSEKLTNKNLEINKIKQNAYSDRISTLRDKEDMEKEVFVNSLSEKFQNDFEKILAVYQEKIGQTLNEAYRYYFISNN